jgi:DNA-binding NtrC family response regulator
MADRSSGENGLIGDSAPAMALRQLIGKAAGSQLPVLLLGDSGTGKEVAARSIHQANPRGEFVPIDCGALVGSLMESELFGHVKGSFSGATENKQGLIELADGGTAFFDEIGDLPLEMQVKLLRLIQEREFRAVGSLKWRKVDIRIIAATHRDLKREVEAGRFRLDLFYRLNVFTIRLPSLRARRDDIPMLVQHFLHGAQSSCAQPFALSPEVLAVLCRYDWPGNVRELKHCIERLAAMRSDGAQQIADLPSAVQNYMAASSLERLADAVAVSTNKSALPYYHRSANSPVISIQESERQTIHAALNATQGERGRAAELLKISRTTLYRRMKQYGLQ